MNFRTDLALERHESAAEGELEGVLFEQKTEEGIKISHITVTNEEGEKALGKAKGRYITAELPSLALLTERLESWSSIISRQIKSLLPEKGTVLVAGLGNRDITPDALGPECVGGLIATRHISDEINIPDYLRRLRSVAGLVPGVLGDTGIETAEILRGVVAQAKISAVIVIDALAARSLERLGCTVQMCDTGVSPGSGVGNKRRKIDREFLGVPVIAVGIPTVVDGVTVAFDILEKAGAEIEEEKRKALLSGERGMMVTPKEIDLVIKRAAKLLSFSINKALQPDMTCGEILSLQTGS